MSLGSPIHTLASSSYLYVGFLLHLIDALEVKHILIEAKLTLLPLFETMPDFVAKPSTVQT